MREKARAGLKFALRMKTKLEVVDDGFKWRKYGKKAVKRPRYPTFSRAFSRLTQPDGTSWVPWLVFSSPEPSSTAEMVPENATGRREVGTVARVFPFLFRVFTFSFCGFCVNVCMFCVYVCLSCLKLAGGVRKRMET